MRKRLWATLTAAGATVLATACSSSPDTPASPRPPAGRYARTAPDRIAVEVFGSDKLVRLERLEASLRATCMAKRGHPQLAQAAAPGPEPTLADLNVTAPGFATISEADARRVGFGQDEPARPPHVMSFHAGFDRAFEQCTEKAVNGIGRDYPEVRRRSYDMMRIVNDEIRVASTTGEDAAAFRAIAAPVLDCLDRAGFSHDGGERNLRAYGVGLPKGTLAGPERATPKRIRGTVEVLPATPPRRYTPAADEVALAVTANRCARATRFAEKYVSQRLRTTREILTRHEVELADLATALAELAGRHRG